MGREIKDDFNFTVAGGSTQPLRNFTHFVIFNPLSAMQPYASDASGYLGLGPYTTDQGDERDLSFMYQLKQAGAIKHNIATYNITFNANAGQGSQSYV